MNERQVERALEALEGRAGAFNTAADRLQLIPATAKRAEGVAFELYVQRGGAAAGELIATDLKGTIKPALTRLRVLELGSNRIRSIEGLETLGGLQELWLGRNRITTIAGVGHLRKLRKLSIQSNRRALRSAAHLPRLCFPF